MVERIHNNTFVEAVIVYQQQKDPISKINSATIVYRKATEMVSQAAMDKRNDIIESVKGLVETVWIESSQINVPNTKSSVYNRILDSAEAYAKFLKQIK